MYERIRSLREDRDMTQTEVSALLNCSQRIYSNYERGEVSIPTNILIKLADLHRTSTDYILNRTDRKEPYPPKKERTY
jgi:transcriptional regulator with XRE-family HTH domain